MIHHGCFATAALRLLHLHQASKGLAVRVVPLQAAANTSSLTIVGPRNAGEPLYIVAALRSVGGRAAPVAHNARLAVSGEHT